MRTLSKIWRRYLKPLLIELRSAMSDLMGPPIEKYDFEK